MRAYVCRCAQLAKAAKEASKPVGSPVFQGLLQTLEQHAGELRHKVCWPAYLAFKCSMSCWRQHCMLAWHIDWLTAEQGAGISFTAHSSRCSFCPCCKGVFARQLMSLCRPACCSTESTQGTSQACMSLIPASLYRAGCCFWSVTGMQLPLTAAGVCSCRRPHALCGRWQRSSTNR